jgi:hypothetical protein
VKLNKKNSLTEIDKFAKAKKKKDQIVVILSEAKS